jgi:hypothetical protein
VQQRVGERLESPSRFWQNDGPWLRHWLNPDAVSLSAISAQLSARASKLKADR